MAHVKDARIAEVARSTSRIDTAAFLVAEKGCVWGFPSSVPS